MTHTLSFVITLLLVLTYGSSITFQQDTLSTKCFTDVSYSSLKSNDLIVGVKSYFTLFVWRSKFGNTATQQDENVATASDNKNQFIREWIDKLEKPLMVGVEYKYFNLFETLISTLHMDHSKLTIKKIYLTDELCRVSNLYEEFDALFLEPYKFTYFVRIYREHDMKRTSAKYINPSDFYPFQMLASNLTIIDRKSCPSDVDIQSDISKHYLNYEEFMYSLGNYSCEHRPDYYDNQHLRLLSGISNFTENDIILLQNVTGTSLSFTTQYLNEFSSGSSVHSIHSFNSSVLNQILLPSSCHFCSATLCPEYHINNDELWSIGQVGVILIYFFAFFISGSFKSMVFTQRLALPYAPILSFIVMIFFSKNVASYCFVAFHIVSLQLSLWYLLLFTFTVARLVYMRNMYKIVKNSTNIKIHKIVASPSFGLIISLVVLPSISTFITFYGAAMFFINNNQLDLFRNIFLMVFLFGGCLLGLISISFDMFYNRRNIKEKGFLKFLFFDDPYLVRLELILLVMLLLIGIWTVIISLLPSSLVDISGRYINFLVSLFTTLACGGNALIAELIKKLIYRKKFNTEKDRLDHLLLTNQDLYELFKDYCSKEFSLENILFFEKLKQASSNFTRADSKLSKELIEEMEKDFFTPYGKYELNIPGNVRKQIIELFQKSKSKGNSTEELLKEEETILVSQLMDLIYIDLLLNLNDTFTRLQRTREFQRWKEVYTLQSKMSVSE
ncbi:predicted protein [Naegleria gruberi]|uniref:Predicted protein n=1 Tax=Naegleria gruberi TaxID=5762 RepID=D2VZT8_NAEGR|nr:uncharacterized protein NAEGRDRAFT_74614 [Naegleria gruberi]EFC37586.1 predicted protein [Naegleria gruberi]|eukprot:XP_002670330.1 predicted protein [Naegleria gruberi strain NEG-M]